MICKCGTCKKDFDALHPKLWRYRRGTTFFCSWGCLRKYDREKGADKVKLTQEQKDEAVRVALDGKNPLAYIRECGVANPTSSWQHIKKQLEKRDPEKYAALPAKLPKAGAKDVPAPIGGGDWEKAEVPEPVATVKVDGPLKIETPEAGKVQVVEKPEKDFPPITAPVAYDGMLVREVEGLFGRYRHSAVGSAVYIDFESADRMDTLSYTIDQWRMFRAEQEKAARILGVEL